jgi:hypothetical protein
VSRRSDPAGKRWARAGRWIALTLALAWPGAAPAPLAAQLGAEVRDALRVYFDCQGRRCESSYYRTEIDFVNWVRDRTLAQVHLIMTSQRNASGGFEYRFDFLGLEDLEGADDQLMYRSLGTDTEDEALRGISRVMAIGLARYSVLSGFDEGLEVARSGEQRPGTESLVTADEVDDPWNFWVFSVGTSGSYSGESTQSSARLRANFSASRTTTEWRILMRGNGSWSRSSFELSNGDEFVDERTNWSTSAEIVRAIAERWSIGFETGASRSTRSNQDLGFDFLPAVEYSFFPYEESPRRLLRIFYEVGIRYFDWEEETIFRKTTELRPIHAARIILFQRQPWGETFSEVEYSNYLDDFSQNRIRFSGNLSLRLFRGLRWNVGGSVERIRDQLFIPAGGLSDEEILLQRRARASTFDWRINMGLSYQFGSIFNNVVFNRF